MSNYTLSLPEAEHPFLLSQASSIPKLPSIDKGSPRSGSGGGALAKTLATSSHKQPLRKSQAADSAEEAWEEAGSEAEGGALPLEDSTVSRFIPVDDGGLPDPDLIPGIETGEHVVEFYAKYGQDSAVKFFYCNRWRRGGHRRVTAGSERHGGGGYCQH